MAKQEDEESRMATQEAEAELEVDANLGQKRVRQQKHLFSGQDGHDDTKTRDTSKKASQPDNVYFPKHRVLS